jgi:hypothetical protein
MPEFVVDFRLLDALIYSAVALAIYLVYTYFNSKPAHVPKPVMDKMPVETDAVNKLVNSAPVNNTANTGGNLGGLGGKEKLRAAAKKDNHLLLNKADVKDKSNYICNKACPCDERTMGESLEDIRKQFLHPTESFYGNLTKMAGVPLDQGFKLNNGTEHKGAVKMTDQAVINSVLGCKVEYAKMNNTANMNNTNAPTNNNVSANVV